MRREGGREGRGGREGEGGGKGREEGREGGRKGEGGKEGRGEESFNTKFNYSWQRWSNVVEICVQMSTQLMGVLRTALLVKSPEWLGRSFILMFLVHTSQETFSSDASAAFHRLL